MLLMTRTTCSQRWRYFFSVPKVKFVMYLFFHIAHLLLLMYPDRGIELLTSDPSALNRRSRSEGSRAAYARSASQRSVDVCDAPRSRA